MERNAELDTYRKIKKMFYSYGFFKIIARLTNAKHCKKLICIKLLHFTLC